MSRCSLPLFSLIFYRYGREYLPSSYSRLLPLRSAKFILCVLDILQALYRQGSVPRHSCVRRADYYCQPLTFMTYLIPLYIVVDLRTPSL